MYFIDTIKVEEDCLQITVKYNNIIIGQKILELNFNEDRKPSFVESGNPYCKIEFKQFIDNLDNGSSFSFDDQDRFDGFIVNEKYLLIKHTYEMSNNAIWIELNENTKDGIKSDLLKLYEEIDKMINLQMKYYLSLENPFEDIE
jgi:hypothetical protein